MASPTVRRFKEGDEIGLGHLLDSCFGRFETWTSDRVSELTAAPGSDIAELWVALDGSRYVGCVRVFGVPQAGTYVVRELAVDTEPQEPVAAHLLDVALEYLKGLDPWLIRGSTLDLAPYPETYRQEGFTAVRRALTLVWDLTAPLPAAPTWEDSVKVANALWHSPERLAELYVEGMRPYWDWLIEERGGAPGYKERFAAHVAGLADNGSDQMWLTAEMEGSAVGLAYVTKLDEDEADMGGVYVLPGYRGRGVGSALMWSILSGIRERTKRLVVPETVSSLDSDIPSIRLYKRWGARVRAEYLHLQLAGASLRP